VDRLRDVVNRYGEDADDDEPENLHANSLDEPRTGPLGLLRDLQDVHLLATFVETTWSMIGQAAEALHDADLLEIVATCMAQTHTQVSWLETRMKQAAPQALVAAGR